MECDHINFSDLTGNCLDCGEEWTAEKQEAIDKEQAA